VKILKRAAKERPYSVLNLGHDYKRKAQQGKSEGRGNVGEDAWARSDQIHNKTKIVKERDSLQGKNGGGGP